MKCTALFSSEMVPLHRRRFTVAQSKLESYRELRSKGKLSYVLDLSTERTSFEKYHPEPMYYKVGWPVPFLAALCPLLYAKYPTRHPDKGYPDNGYPEIDKIVAQTLDLQHHKHVL